MVSKKRILYFMPDNPISGHAGNLTRTLQMLSYFEENSNRLDVDFASISEWKDDSRERFKELFPSIRLRVIDMRISIKHLINYLCIYKIPKLFRKVFPKQNHIDWSTPIFRYRLKRLIKEESYDLVVISYASWGSFITAKMKPYFILDSHDFVTVQYLQKEGLGKRVNIGKEFAKEVEILKKFDEIWTYSIEEQYVFEQFTNRKITLMPVSFPARYAGLEKRPFNMIYIASDNPHNVKSINWFIHQVLPLLPNQKLHMVGNICDKIDEHHQIIKLGVVDDIGDVYKMSKISICPMLSGTGVKIKILEALSYGLPVVTSQRGLDGLINKINNGCLVATEEEKFAQTIINLLSDEVYYQHIAQQAREFHQSFYTKEREVAILDTIFG